MQIGIDEEFAKAAEIVCIFTAEYTASIYKVRDVV